MKSDGGFSSIARFRVTSRMIWIAPPEKDSANGTLEKRLWGAAEQAVPAATFAPKAQKYSGPILGLIFLRFAEVRFAFQRARLEKAGTSSRYT